MVSSFVPDDFKRGCVLTFLVLRASPSCCVSSVGSHAQRVKINANKKEAEEMVVWNGKTTTQGDL